MKPIMIFAFSAPGKTFQRIWPVLVTVEIKLSFDRLKLASTTEIGGSTVTVLQIMRLLSPVQQGYYYTPLSLLSLQAISEQGFSVFIE